MGTSNAMSRRKLIRNTFALGAGALLTAACSNSKSPNTAATAKPSSTSKGGKTAATITVVLGNPPPKADLQAFTKQTGIKVNWVNLDWDSMQTKISAAATAKTYFADATDVDWSRVGQLGKLGWFYPMDSYLDTGSMLKDMPQLASFTVDGHVVGIPYDASFMVTTINKAIFDKAGADPEPKTIDAYTNALKKIKQAGTVNYPLNIPFSAAEGLSTYWYETTGAFGGTILDEKGMPQFSTPDSAGYKAMQWMVDALKNGLVPPGNINVSDSQGQQTLMAKGKVASTFSDYSGNIGSLYNLKSASSVVGDVHYLRTPGVSGPAGNLSNPDGIGIPKQAKDPQAAATFIKWFTEKNQQLNFSGVNGASKALEGYNMPSRLSAVQVMTQKGALVQGQILGELLKKSQPVFKGGAPKWYPQFSNAVYTNLHAAAAGSMDVASAIKTISDTAERLAQNGS